MELVKAKIHAMLPMGNRNSMMMVAILMMLTNIISLKVIVACYCRLLHIAC